MQTKFTRNSKASTAAVKFRLPESSLNFGTAHPGPYPAPNESISETSTHFFMIRSSIILGLPHCYLWPYVEMSDQLTTPPLPAVCGVKRLSRCCRETDLEEVVCGGKYWNDPAQDMNGWRAL
jgi:hypothetical protein